MAEWCADPAPGTRHPAPGTRHPAPGTRHPAPGTRRSRSRGSSRPPTNPSPPARPWPGAPLAGLMSTRVAQIARRRPGARRADGREPLSSRRWQSWPRAFLRSFLRRACRFRIRSWPLCALRIFWMPRRKGRQLLRAGRFLRIEVSHQGLNIDRGKVVRAVVTDARQRAQYLPYIRQKDRGALQPHKIQERDNWRLHRLPKATDYTCGDKVVTFLRRLDRRGEAHLERRRISVQHQPPIPPDI